MNTHMNPNFPITRGCFIDKRAKGKFTVVDYPSWSNDNGHYVKGEFNTPMTENYTREFKTLKEAVDFTKADNYVICNDPWSSPKNTPAPAIEEDLTEFDQ